MAANVIHISGVNKNGKTKLLYRTIAPEKGIVYPQIIKTDMEKKKIKYSKGLGNFDFRVAIIENNSSRKRMIVSTTAGM